MQYIGLCSGSKGNSWVIKHQKSTILIDCGCTKKYLKEKLEENDVSLDEIDALLITHAHSDHIKQVNMFSEKKIYGTCDCCSTILDKYEQFLVGSFKITTLPLSHDSPKTVGYLIEADNEKLVYISDTGYIHNDVIKHIKNLDYYLFESNHDVELLMQTKRPYFLKSRILSDTGHLSNVDCGKILYDVIGDNTKEITLVHLSEEANTPETALSTVKSQLNGYKGILQTAEQYSCIKGGK